MSFKETDTVGTVIWKGKGHQWENKLREVKKRLLGESVWDMIMPQAVTAAMGKKGQNEKTS